jgi:hypothetical protein
VKSLGGPRIKGLLAPPVTSGMFLVAVRTPGSHPGETVTLVMCFDLMKDLELNKVFLLEILFLVYSTVELPYDTCYPFFSILFEST